jgi:hypothetical protein
MFGMSDSFPISPAKYKPDKNAPGSSRTLAQTLVLFVVSVLPLAIGYALLTKFVLDTFVWLLNIVEFVSSTWVGYLWYRRIRLNYGIPEVPEGPDDHRQEHRPADWVALVCGVVVIFGVYFFLRTLSTHAIARAFDQLQRDE